VGGGKNLFEGLFCGADFVFALTINHQLFVYGRLASRPYYVEMEQAASFRFRRTSGASLPFTALRGASFIWPDLNLKRVIGLGCFFDG
jgi:hypothetical protein